MKQLAGRVAVITGAASGIGRATARHLAREQCRLALSDLDVDGLARLQTELQQAGVEVLTAKLDVASVEAMNAFAEQVFQRFGRVDIVINNAGVAYTDPVEKADLQNMHWLMNINFWGVVHGCRAFLPYLRQQPESSLVNISSIFAMVSYPTQAIYNAAKAAVRGFSDALRIELRDSGVTLTCVHPGGVKTNIVRNARIGDLSMVADNAQDYSADFDKVAGSTPEQAAAAIVGAIKAKKTRLLIGVDARILDWLYRLAPARVPYWFDNLNRLGRKLMQKRRAGAAASATR